jgi:hypothetical protein
VSSGPCCLAVQEHGATCAEAAPPSVTAGVPFAEREVPIPVGTEGKTSRRRLAQSTAPMVSATWRGDYAGTANGLMGANGTLSDESGRVHQTNVTFTFAVNNVATSSYTGDAGLGKVRGGARECGQRCVAGGEKAPVRTK